MFTDKTPDQIREYIVKEIARLRAMHIGNEVVRRYIAIYTNKFEHDMR